MRCVISLDPGLYSGMAVWLSDHPALLVHQVEVPYANTGETLEIWMDAYSRYPQEFAVERYTMTPGVKSAQPEALKLMGVAEHIAQRNGVPLHYYAPAATKKMIPNSLLRQVGWYRATKDGHANDGARLVLAHLAVVDAPVFTALTSS